MFPEASICGQEPLFSVSELSQDIHSLTTKACGEQPAIVSELGTEGKFWLMSAGQTSLIFVFFSSN